MDPAGATASMLRYGTWTRPHSVEDGAAAPAAPAVPTMPAAFSAGQSRQTYPSAASSAAGRSRTDVLERVISSGAKTRSRIRSSHERPVRRSTRYPAVKNIRFWYCQRLRNDALGSRYLRRRYSSSRLKLRPYHSPSCRGSPERCVTRSRGVISRVAKSSYS